MGVRSSRFVLFVSMLGALAAFLVALVVGSATNADTSSPAVTSAISTPAPVVSDEQPAPGTEVVDRRTEDSKTYERADGAYVTRLFPQAVNFRDGDNWRSIDNTLVAAGTDGYVHRRANAGDALIPRSLDDPFKVSKDGDWVSFELQNPDPGATDAALDGNTATFDGVADATRAEYDAVNDGLKETLTLTSAQAPRSFAYAVKASDGLSPQQADDGSIRFTDGQGHVLFVFSAPIAWDAAQPQTVSHAARLALTGTQDGWRVTLSIDGDWLSDPARRFPVTIDPNVQWPGGGEMRYSGAQRDCTLSSAMPTTSACSNPALTVGSTSSSTYKSLLYFNTRQVIPQDADVFDATLLMHVGGTGTAPASNLRVRPITRDWTNAATWNTTNGSTAWTTPGGDASATATDASPPVSVSGLNAWYYWAIPAGVAQDWIDGSRSDFGLQVAADSGSPTQTYAFESTDGDPYKWPAVDIYWEEDQGAKSTYTLDTQRLSDSSQVAVNVANGDLMYSAADAHIAGTNGLDLNSARVWDSVDNWTQGTYALGWTDTNHLQLVHDDKDGSVYIADQTGAHYRFAPLGTGTFTTPAGLNATLCTIGVASGCTRDGVNTGIKYKLTDNATGRRYYLWESSGVVGAIKDTASNTINFDWQSTYQQINGTNNTRLRFNLDTSSYATSLTDGTHTALFLRGGTPDPNMLRSNTDFTGVTTTYTYNDAGYLSRITDTQGHDTRIDWQEVPDFGSWRATKITRVLDAAHLSDATKNPTISYSYDVANHTTVVTDAAGNATATPTDDGQTTYTYDNTLHVTSASPRTSALPAAPTWSPADSQGDTTRPTNAPSGDLHSDGLYVDGQGTTNITLGATDPAASSGGTISGIRRVALEEGDNANQPNASQSTCSEPASPPRSCPASVSPTVALDETRLSEGAHHFRQVTQDLAGNTSESTSWTVIVDRTAPSPPGYASSDPVATQTVAADALRAALDPTGGTATLTWGPAYEQLSSSGEQGSGVGHYAYSYRLGGGNWVSGTTADNHIALGSVASGVTVEVRLRAYDDVGNASAEAQGTTVVGADSYRSEVMADTPSSYWRLGEPQGATTAVDEMGHVNGTYVNNPRLGEDSLLGADDDTAMHVGGTDAGVDLGQDYAFDGRTPFSAEVLVRAEDAQDPDSHTCDSAPFGTSCSHEYVFDKLVGNYGVDRRGWAISIRGDGRLEFQRWADNVGTVVTSTAPLQDEQPAVVDVTYDGTTMRLYVDGVLAGAEVASTGNLPMSTYPLLLGPTTVESRLSAPYDGTLDEASLYPTALTATRIAAHASAAELGTANLGPVGDIGQVQFGIFDRKVFFVPVFDTFHISRDRAGRRVLSIHAGWKFLGRDDQAEYAGSTARLELVIERRVGDSPWQPVGDIEPKILKQSVRGLGSGRRVTSKVEVTSTPDHLSSYRGRLDIDLIGKEDPPNLDYSRDQPRLGETPTRFLP